MKRPFSRGSADSRRPADSSRSRNDAPALGAREFGRWIWRQLTSMSTALLLLLLLALGAIPGSLIPQESVDPSAVSRFRTANPELSVWLERLGIFNLYSSVWFSAIYLLLMVSLVGCIVPRLATYARAMRAQPGKAPKRLTRLPAHDQFIADEPADEVAASAERWLRGRRHRVRTYTEPSGSIVVTAEKGYLREAGNLVFHLAVVFVLIGVALSSLYGFKGSIALAEGRTFTNQLLSYDDFTPGARYSADDLEPFAMRLDKFDVSYQRSGVGRGTPTDFTAHVTVTEPGGEPYSGDIKVNEPLKVGGAHVFLVANGYAPRVTVWDGEGRQVHSDAVLFLPQDLMNTSYGVIKAPDANPEQLGFEGFFFPTASVGANMGRPVSTFPDADNPVLSLIAYRGNIGLDTGEAQSVYVLDKAGLDRIESGGRPFPLILSPGETIALPDGLGRVRFDGWVRYARLEVNRSPADGLPLVAGIAGIIGLLGSLFIRPRRTWVRVAEAQGRTLVEAAALDRVAGGDPPSHVRALVQAMRHKEDT